MKNIKNDDIIFVFDDVNNIKTCCGHSDAVVICSFDVNVFIPSLHARYLTTM